MKRIHSAPIWASVLSVLVLAGAASAADQPLPPTPAPTLLSCSFERLDKEGSKFCTATVFACFTRNTSIALTDCATPGSYVVTCDDHVIYKDGYIAGTANLDSPGQDAAIGIVSGRMAAQPFDKATFPAIRIGADFITGDSFQGKPAVLQLGTDSDDWIRGTCDHTGILR